MSAGALDGRSINRADLASLCSVSLPTIDAWVSKGCPYVERGSKGREWQFDSAAVIDWRIQRAVEQAVSGFEDESGKVSREEADRRKAVANAITAEVGADEVLKAVVNRHEVEADMASFCQVLKTGLGNASSKIASRATTMTNASEIEDLCHAELNRAFEAADVELATRWGHDDAAGREDGGEDQPA